MLVLVARSRFRESQRVFSAVLIQVHVRARLGRRRRLGLRILSYHAPAGQQPPEIAKAALLLVTEWLVPHSLI